METVKTAEFAGKFYPCDREKLCELLISLFNTVKKDYKTTTRAIIAPHAGYMYSGKTAAAAFQYLDKNIKNVFVFAPAHRCELTGIALSSFDCFETPLGKISLNQDLIKELSCNTFADFADEAYSNEHAIEVQLPFIQSLAPNAKLIPVLYGNISNEEISGIIEKYWENKDNAFVVSSDLSHFYSQKDAEKIDKYTAEMIELQNIEGFQPLQACGSTGITGLVKFAKNRGFSLVRTELTTSAEVSNVNDSVVGYGAWILAEKKKSLFIKEEFSDLVLSLCKDSILAGIETGNSLDVDEKLYPEVFYELGACFVTITINQKLRGCIGSIFAHKPLLNDLAQNAYKAAFSDSRFAALTLEEFPYIKLGVSLLSQPEPVNFKDEEDLLNNIVPYKDGIIIQDGNYSAVYLPSVWVQLPDKKEFLKSLKQKAGLPAEYFSKTFKAYRFHTVYIDEK